VIRSKYNLEQLTNVKLSIHDRYF